MRRVFLVSLAVVLYACGPSSEGEKDVASSDNRVEDGADALPVDASRSDGDQQAGDIVGEGTSPEQTAPDTKVLEAEYKLFSIAPSKDLLAVWGTGDVLYAVGEDGAIIRRQGSYWSPMRSPTTEDLHFVFGLGENDVYAGGYGGMVFHFDGTEWAEETTGVDEISEITLRGAWGEGEDLYVVGDKGTILHLHGDKWVKEDSLSTYNLPGIWGVSLVDIYVSAAGGTVLRRMGGAWSTQQVTMGSVTLNAIFGFSNKELWAGGTGGALAVHDAGGWNPEISNDAYERTIHSVWAFSPSDVWYIGADGALIHSKGSKWMTSDIAATYYKNHSFYGLWGLQDEESNQAFAVGEKGAILHYDGTDWLPEASAPDVNINDVAGTSWEDVVAVGGDGLVLRFDGKSWAGLDRLVDKELTAVAPFGSGYLAVGKGGTVLSVEGDAVAVVDAGLTAGLLGICSAAGKIAAVGEQGKIFTSTDGTTWTTISSGVFDSLRDCTIDETGKVLAAGDMGRIVVVDGGAGELQDVSTIANLHRITLDADGTPYVVGDNGLILREGTDGFEKVHEEPGLFLYGVHAFGNQVVAVGWAGRIINYNADTDEVEQVEAPDSGVLLQVWGPDAGHVFVVGKKGKMLRFETDE